MNARLSVACMAAVALLGCAAPKPSVPPGPPAPEARPLPGEGHLADLRQLTFGGENAEAYWSFDGAKLSFQARGPDEACDRIYWMDALSAARPAPVPISTGQGATTCAHFFPGDRELLYASTHLGGAACPPKPDFSKGYVWALYDTFDIFKVRLGAPDLIRLTETPGYDAEGTVCAKDGSIVFTSVRDGDLELYRMDADGKNVKRLTNTPGYDGGAFFNADCSKIVWRASRPKPGKELDEYKALLAQGLVRPSQLELYVANADGSEPMQVTSLGAASFAPFWFPGRDRIIFSSNSGDPKGREFDLWAVNANGTGLERITAAPGFDGFPMFSPDGRYLAFSSNRATAPGGRDTNVFVARWVDSPPPPVDGPAERILRDAAWLASPERGGRGVGAPGLEAAGAYLEEQFQKIGLEPAGAAGYRQSFQVTVGVKIEKDTRVSIGGSAVPPEELTVLGSSAQGEVSGQMVLASYGLVDPEGKADDYAKLDVRGKVVLVRRFVPEAPAFADPKKQRRLGDLRQKVWLARERGAKAVVIVDWPLPPTPAPKEWQMPQESRLPKPRAEGPGDTGIPVVLVKRSAVEKHMAALERGKAVPVSLKVALSYERANAFNVVGRLRAGAPEPSRLPGAVVVGAHYDHLGLGGPESLAPDKSEPHLGADDNASGTASVLEVARALAARREQLSRDVWFIAFSGEEKGTLGSTEFTRAPPQGLSMKDVVAMLNLDMVGKLRSNTVSVLGAGSAEEWPALLDEACAKERLSCNGTGDGYGPSDNTPFYAAGAPVLFFFTGVEPDYHKPSDSADKLNAEGMARIAGAAMEVTLAVANRTARLTYRNAPMPAPEGDMRSFNASLGSIPDYAGPPGGQKGVLLAGVRAGGAADKAGLRRGDLLVRLGTHEVGSVEDLMYALNASKPGQLVKVVVLRDGKPLELEATLQESQRR